MASGRLWNYELCPECGKQVEILNGDVPFSMELHLQAHKPLETINHEIEMQYKNPSPQPINSQLSPRDGSLTFDLQTVICKTASLDIQSEEKSSTSSKKTNKMENLKVMSNSTTPSNDLLNDVFGSIPSELKSHRGFISVNGKGELFCNVCKVTIKPIISLNEHLKTRLHEDRTIKFFTDTLPDELHHIMEFVSFYNSRLCCNLCKFNFYFYPDNPNDTMYSIMKHYLSKEHLEKKTRHGLLCNCGESSEILKSFSRLNQVIYNNQQYLEFKMQPEFRCKLCNVVVGYNLNERSLYKSLNEHFISEIHLTSKAASELKAYVALNIISEQKHHFTITEGSILCLTCNQYVEPNVHELTCHVKRLPCNKTPHNLSLVECEQAMPCPASTENIQSTLKTPKSPGRLSGAREHKSDNLEGAQSSLTQKMKITQFVVEPKVHELMPHTEQLPLNEIIHSLLPEESEEAVPTVSTGKQQPTTDDLIILNHQNVLLEQNPLEKNTENQESLLELTLKQAKNTCTVVEPNVDELIQHMKLPQDVVYLSDECKQGASPLASTENSRLNINDTSALPGERPEYLESIYRIQQQMKSNLESIYRIQQQQMKSTHTLKPDDHQDLLRHGEQLLHSNMQYKWLPAESKGASVLASTENNSSNTSYIKVPVVSASVKNNKGIIQSLLRSLPQELKNTKCIVENRQGQIVCSICKCPISLDKTCIKQHLLGKNHKKLESYSQKYGTIEKCYIKSKDSLNRLLKDEVLGPVLKPLVEDLNLIEFRPKKKRALCLVCNTYIAKHINCVQDHLRGNLHNQSKKHYKY